MEFQDENYTFRGIRAWNSIPDSIEFLDNELKRTLVPRKMFSKNLKDFITNIPRY